MSPPLSNLEKLHGSSRTELDNAREASRTSHMERAERRAAMEDQAGSSQDYATMNTVQDEGTPSGHIPPKKPPHTLVVGMSNSYSWAQVIKCPV